MKFIKGTRNVLYIEVYKGFIIGKSGNDYIAYTEDFKEHYKNKSLATLHKQIKNNKIKSVPNYYYNTSMAVNNFRGTDTIDFCNPKDVFRGGM